MNFRNKSGADLLHQTREVEPPKWNQVNASYDSVLQYRVLLSSLECEVSKEECLLKCIFI